MYSYDLKEQQTMFHLVRHMVDKALPPSLSQYRKARIVSRLYSELHRIAATIEENEYIGSGLVSRRSEL